MVGIFPWKSKMLEKRKAIVYREVAAISGCPFLEKEQNIRGHEFHYSEITEVPAGIKKTYKVQGSRFKKEGYLYKNTLASYVHLHFASNPEFANGFIKKCKGYKNANSN